LIIDRLLAVINQEKTIHNIEEFDKSKLKHTETEVKNPLPDKEGEIVLVFATTVTTTIHRVSKNVPPSTCYSLDMHDPITIIFDRIVTGKVGNQTMLCFPTAPIEYFCITLRNKKPRRQRTGALCRQRSPTAAAPSTSILLNHAPNTPYSRTH